jgi:hypothetical protein
MVMRETEVELETTLRYHGDISEKMAEALWPAIEELDASGDTRSGLRLDKDVRITGSLTVTVLDDEPANE